MPTLHVCVCAFPSRHGIPSASCGEAYRQLGVTCFCALLLQGRLLHYFPPTPSKPDSRHLDAAADTRGGQPDSTSLGNSTAGKNKENDSSKTNTEEQGEEDWCGWHTDHGSLTGLTSAMYMKGDEVVPNPDPQAGLYIRGRQGGEVTQAPVPSDHIAYQMGEAMQVCLLKLCTNCSSCSSCYSSTP